MFTGLVEALGVIVEFSQLPAGMRVGISADLAVYLKLGDSVAVNGVCLTVVLLDAETFFVDVSPETLKVTMLHALTVGATVNLERPLLPTTRLGGHFVQGHVDGVGEIETINQDEEFWLLTVRYPSDLESFIVHKGSIAVDGVSLTVAALAHGCFDVQIIPFTWNHTHLSTRLVNDPVNLECDIIGKYVLRAIEQLDIKDDRKSTSIVDTRE